ncbi:hypothetical protein [Leifsonia sp. fls2-241-R2A-40a]|uniref:hypothetical protein n=1 Tax=Leifsonia sp. fls2-241-R2A-40a TaxID=3040290 RepID=UPI002550414D|nr:hypothetical protein [Leifsonia sp. fls2-241-R2A-40a]
MSDSHWETVLGPCYTTETISKRLGIPQADVELWADDLRLLRVQATETPVFPAWQLTDQNEPIPGLQGVLLVLRDGVNDPLSWANFLTASVGHPPTRAIDQLNAGDVAAVLLRARHAAASWRA